MEGDLRVAGLAALLSHKAGLAPPLSYKAGLTRAHSHPWYGTYSPNPATSTVRETVTSAIPASSATSAPRPLTDSPTVHETS